MSELKRYDIAYKPDSDTAYMMIDKEGEYVTYEAYLEQWSGMRSILEVKLREIAALEVNLRAVTLNR